MEAALTDSSYITWSRGSMRVCVCVCVCVHAHPCLYLGEQGLTQ